MKNTEKDFQEMEAQGFQYALGSSGLCDIFAMYSVDAHTTGMPLCFADSPCFMCENVCDGYKEAVAFYCGMVKERKKNIHLLT